MFGIFRKGGKKSKDPKYDGSSESLNVRNSADFGSTASDLSLVGSSVSTESTTVEKVEHSQQNAVNENANAKLQSNATENKRRSEEIEPTLADIVYQGKEKTTPRKAVEKVERSQQNTVNENANVKLQSDGTENKRRSEEVEPTLADIVYQGKEKTIPRKADKDDSSPKQHRISEKLQATGQPESETQQQKTFIKKSQEESFEVRVQSSTITVKSKEDSESGHRDRDPDYKEEKDLPQDHSLEEKVQNDSPFNADAIMPKQQVHDQRNDHFEMKDETRGVVSSESLLKRQTVSQIKATPDEEFKVSVEQSVISTEKKTSGPTQNDSQDHQVQNEAVAKKEEAAEIVFPDKHQVSYQHAQQDDIMEDESPIVEAVSNNVESELEVNEFLSTNVKETWAPDEGSHDKMIEKEREMKGTKTAEANQSRQQGLDNIYDNRKQSSHFGEETDFSSTSSKPLSLSNKTDAENDFESSVDAPFINTIKDVKMSSTMLLAELGEVNKKLHELKKELLQVLKKGRKEP